MSELTPLAVFALGIAPRLSTLALEALAHGCASDDPRLIEEATTLPLSSTGLRYRTEGVPVEAACAVAYALWIGEGIDTVAALEDALNGLMLNANARLRTRACPRPSGIFYSWWDNPEIQRRSKLRLLGQAAQRAVQKRKAART